MFRCGQCAPSHRRNCGPSRPVGILRRLATTPGATPMPHSGFTYASLMLSALVAVALAAATAQAQAPRPGQLAPGPGQTPPPGPRGQPPQATPPGPRGQAQQQAPQP